MKFFSKLKYIVFSFMCLFVVNTINVNAEEITITTLDEYKNAINMNSSSTTDTIKLGADIYVNNVSSDDIIVNAYKDLTFDLNGYTLRFESYGINVWSYADLKVSIIDSSVNKLGQIIQENENYPAVKVSAASDHPFHLEVKDIKVDMNNNDIAAIFGEKTSSANIVAKLTMNNVRFINTRYAIGVIFGNIANGFNEFSISNVYMSPSNYFNKLHKISNLTVNDMVGSNQELVYYNNGILTVANETDAVDTLTSDRGKMLAIRSKDGFNIDDVKFDNLELGYDSSNEKSIKITNYSNNSLEIKSIKVDSNDFVIDFNNEVLPKVLNSNEVLENIKIKARDGLSAGDYKAIIIVTDSNDNNYYASVTVSVLDRTDVNLKLTLKNTSSDSFVFDKTNKSPDVDISYDNNTIDDSDLIITYVGRNGTIYNSSVPPVNAGYYTKIVSVSNDNLLYKGNDSIDFTINKLKLTKPSVNEFYKARDFRFKDVNVKLDNFNDEYMSKSGDLTKRDSGKYKVNISLFDKVNTSWNDNTVDDILLDWEIKVAIIDIPVSDEIDDEAIYTYDGRYHSYESTWDTSYYTVNGKNNIEDVSQMNPGIYKIEVDLIDKINTKWSDNTTDKKVGTLIINKVEISLIATTERDKASIYTYKKGYTRCYQTFVSSLDFKYITVNGKDVTTFECHSDAGTYTYELELKDKNNYMWEDGTTANIVATLIINKAPGNEEEGFEVPTSIQGVVGNKLSTIDLPIGFSWNNEDEVIKNGVNKYIATYTPVDTKNYDVFNGQEIEVTGINKYTITTSVDGGNGTITEFSNKVDELTNVVVKFTPNEGYIIDTVLVNDVDKTKDVITNQYTFIPTKDTNIIVKYKKITFTITIDDMVGGSVSPNNNIIAEYGDDKEIILTLDKGYKIVKVLVNDQDKTDLFNDNKLIITNITENKIIKFTMEQIVYNVLDGENLKYTISQTSEATFRIDADYALFENGGKVYVDNTLLDSINYTSESGSTIITLKKDYVDTLSKGDHTLKVEFNNGGVATANFTVVEVQPLEDNPKTFDDGIMMYIIMGIISTLGIGIVIYRRKQTN